jgi:hypothetical protein
MNQKPALFVDPYWRLKDMKRIEMLVISALCLIILSVVSSNGESVDLQLVSEIKHEGFENSETMETMGYLTDVYGPRLSNSPNYRAASQWCVDKLTEWGLQNARLEPWGTFGLGWAVKRFSVEMVEPQYVNIIAYPKAWTPGTNGMVSGQPKLVRIKSEKDFDKYRGTLHGAIVMTQDPRDAETHFEADASRRTDQQLEELSHAPEPGAKSPREARRAEFRRLRAFNNKVSKFLQVEGVAVVLEPSFRDQGTVRVGRGGDYKSGATQVVPAVVVAAEHYARIARLLERDIAVNLEINIENEFYDDDSTGYNVVAEIPGTDKKLKDEVVMLGGHLDSWHSGTGATDNAAGCVVAMEAVRILQAVGAKPRRTIRIALWGGEEQGLLGSRGYVKNHFGDRRTMDLKEDHDKFSAYFNLDNGTGKIRGVYLQGNDAVRPIFEAYLKPFQDLGATTLTIRNTGGTDHLAFDAVGLPGFQFIQDPIDYSTRTHHTNMDVYDHVLKSDLMQASVIMASFVYHTAMRDAKLPRKALPKPEPPPATNGTN